MRRIITAGADAREKLITGADKVANLARVTLGPNGGNVVLEKGLRVTNDGATIVREVTLPDEIEDLGQRLLKKASERVNDEAGDGTTSTIILAQEILHEAQKRLPGGEKISGTLTPVALLKKIDEEKEIVLKELEKRAEKVTTKERLVQVTRVSVEDQELATLIGEMQWELGEEGTIIPEESNDKECSIERIAGVRIDNGFGTSRVITNPEKQTFETQECRIILTNYSIKEYETIKPILKRLYDNGVREVAVLARAWTDEALLSVQKEHQGGFKIWPLNGPYMDQYEVMKDLEAVLGGTYFDYEQTQLKDMTLLDVGFVEKIIAGRFSAIYTGKGDEEAKKRVGARILSLEAQYKGSESEFEKKNIQARISQLRNGFALLKIGANSDQERKYKYDKASDAVNSAKAALQEGIVPGAGLTFKAISVMLPADSILRPALNSIYTQIMAHGEFEVESWVFDAKKVLRIALTSACSVAGVLATSVGAIANESPQPLDQLLIHNAKNTASGQ